MGAHLLLANRILLMIILITNTINEGEIINEDENNDTTDTRVNKRGGERINRGPADGNQVKPLAILGNNTNSLMRVHLSSKTN